MNSSTPTPHEDAPALDCRRSGVLIPHRPEYGRPPFTVECWVRGGNHDESFAGFDQGWSLRHWQFTIGSDGRFGVMLNRQLPRTLWCSSDCRDGKWHHLAFTSDGQKKSRVVAGLFEAGGSTWFVKLTGDAEAVASARPDFLRLMESLRLE